MPGQARAVHGLLALVAGALLQGVQDRGQAVAAGIKRFGGQEAPLLGEEEEDGAHHDGDDRLVDLVGILRQRVHPSRTHLGGEGSLGQGRHHQLDRPSHLGAQGFGDLLRGQDRVLEELEEALFRGAAHQAAHAQELAEGVTGSRFFHPGLAVHNAGSRSSIRRGAHHGPPAPVGYHANGAVRSRGAKHGGHAVDGTRGPSVVRQVPQGVDWVSDQHQGADLLPAHERPGRGDRHRWVAVGGGAVSLRKCRAVLRRRPRATPAQDLGEHGAHPGVPGPAVGGERRSRFPVRVPGVPGTVEGRLGGAQYFTMLAAQPRHALRVEAGEDGHGEEGALGVDQAQPFPMPLGGAASARGAVAGAAGSLAGGTAPGAALRCGCPRAHDCLPQVSASSSVTARTSATEET